MPEIAVKEQQNEQPTHDQEINGDHVYSRGTGVGRRSSHGMVPPTGCRDSAQYVSDDSMDGTIYAPNMPFSKTWRLKNTGTCSWDSRYLVAYLSGAAMTQQPGYWIVQPGQTVAPGQTVDISVGMTSPVENGDYTAYWGLKRMDGPFMPIQGGANENSFYVKIKVNR